MRTLLLTCAALTASLVGCSDNTGSTSDLAVSEDMASPADLTDLTLLDPLAGNPMVTKVPAGMNFMFTEGPLWVAARSSLFFTDVQANRIYEWKPPSTLTPFRMNTGGANGLALDLMGNLLACEGTSSAVTRQTFAGHPQQIVATYNGQPLNVPNDLIVRKSDGTLYFTDPTQQQLPQSVYRIDPQGTISLIDATGLDFPNGIGLSPDEKTLYVTTSTTAITFKYPVNPDGSVGARSMFAASGAGSDGMAIDDAGNVYVTTQTGVKIYRPDGTQRGVIDNARGLAEVPSNVSFGGADRKTLYITARTSVYQIALAVPGLP